MKARQLKLPRNADAPQMTTEQGKSMTNADETVALIIEHTIKKGEEKRYEQWTAEILKAVSQSPGYLGREVFPSGDAGKSYTIIVRFRNQADVQNWLDSPARKSFVERMEDAFENGDVTSIQAGIDIWFTPESSPNKPPAYKQFLLTAAGIYPLTLIVPRLLAPLFNAVPILGNPFIANVFVTAIVVGLMTWLVMPRLTDWLHEWLFAEPRKTATKRKTETINL